MCVYIYTYTYTYLYIQCIPVLVFTMGNVGPGKCVASDAVAQFSITFQLSFSSSFIALSPSILLLFSSFFQGHYVNYMHIYMLLIVATYILFYYELNTLTLSPTSFETTAIITDSIRKVNSIP